MKRVVLRGRMKRVVLRGRMKRIVGRLLQLVVVAVRGGVGFRIVDRVMIQVCLERLGGVVPAKVARARRRSRRVVCDLAGMGVAVISASRLVSVNIRMSRISSMVGLRGDSGVLQQVVRGDQVELDSRINDCVMVHGWLERGGAEWSPVDCAEVSLPVADTGESWAILPPRPSSETCPAVFVAWFPAPASDAAAALAPIATATAATMVASLLVASLSAAALSAAAFLRLLINAAASAITAAMKFVRRQRT